MNIPEGQLEIIRTGGEERRSLLADGSLFSAGVKQVRAERTIHPVASARAVDFAQTYSLDPREVDIMAVEFDFFLENPATVGLRDAYRDSYDKVAAHLTFRPQDDISENGWRLRWGANTDTVNKAMLEVAWGDTDAELDGRAFNLKGVFFNLEHSKIMFEHDLPLRFLGLYPPAGVSRERA